MAQPSPKITADDAPKPSDPEAPEPIPTPAPTPALYEYPVNERSRVFLRLEHLFQQADFYLQGDSVWDSRAVMSTLIDIIAVFSRPDIKSELIKELERHATSLGRITGNPNVDQGRLSELVDEIGSVTQALHGSRGQIGAILRKHEFLNCITQRNAIPGGTCDFDLPIFHHWLGLTAEQRRQDLTHWLDVFALANKAIELILNLTRHSGKPTRECAEKGFFQRSLNANLPVQLIRVAIPADNPAYPEISGGKHRFSIRFMSLGAERGAHKTEDDINFDLTCCIL